MQKIIKSILLVVFSACITFSAALLYYTYKILPEHNSTKEQLNMIQEVMNSNLHTVFIAARDLSAGEILKAEDVLEDSQYITDVSSMITAEDIGKILITNIPAGSAISSTVVADVTTAENEWLVEYNCFRLSSAITKGAYADIRIRFQNGEDYVVLAKKQIQDKTEDSCYLAVTAEEMQMMASAIVDANLYNASLYTTLYTEPTIQDAVPVTYIPNFSNPQLYQDLYTERNMQLRKELVSRVSGSIAIDAGNTHGVVFGNNVDNTSTVPVE